MNSKNKKSTPYDLNNTGFAIFNDEIINLKESEHTPYDLNNAGFKKYKY